MSIIMILKYWYLIVIFFLIGLLGTGLYFYNNLQDKNELLSKNNIICEMQQESFISAIESQNKLLNDYVKLSDKQKKKIIISQEEIKGIKNSYSKRLKILKEQNTGSSCIETIDWMIKKAQNELR